MGENVLDFSLYPYLNFALSASAACFRDLQRSYKGGNNVSTSVSCTYWRELLKGDLYTAGSVSSLGLAVGVKTARFQELLNLAMQNHQKQ